MPITVNRVLAFAATTVVMAGAFVAITGAHAAAVPVYAKEMVQRKVVVAQSPLDADTRLDKPVGEAHTLENATLSDALRLLRQAIAQTGAKVSIAIADPDESSRRVTMYLQEDMTLRDLMKTVADLYNRAWVKKDDMYVLERRGGLIRSVVPQELPENAQSEELRKRLEDARAAWEKARENMPKIERVPQELRLNLRNPQETAKSLRDAAEALRKAADKEQLTKEEWKAVSEMLRRQADRLEKMADEMAAGRGMMFLGPRQGTYRLFLEPGEEPTPRFLKEWMEQFKGDEFAPPFDTDEFLKRYELEIPRFEFRWDGEGWERFPPAKRERMREWLREHGYDGEIDTPRILRELPEIITPEFLKRFQDNRRIRVGGDIGTLMDSITEEQWRLHKERGYLRFDDLTDEQRKLLGDVGPTEGGDITLTYVINGKKLTIKSG